jgi:ribonucleoside-triphosphate reductase
LNNFRFKLKDSFVNKFSSVEPPFGFNGLGKIAYIRTYSRTKLDGTNEKWFETIRRVVEGTYSIQKEHILLNGLGWDEDKAHCSAEEMYERMFCMKFLPSGRGLWAMGTDLIHERKLSAALTSCAFYSTEDLGNNPTRPFEFMMDMSMLGVGVGFDTKGAGLITFKSPKGVFDFTIPDTREGWVESLKLLLRAYFCGDALPVFDYSIIRPIGAPIKTFGGTSAGYQPLLDLHNRINTAFVNKNGKKITITDIVDIMNWIGACVVAGNVRRTAQISFGDPNSSEYLNLKDYHWNGTSYEGSNAARATYGWSSNNSIFANIGMDYTVVSKQTGVNGEPGYCWLQNAQKYGRICDGPNDKDSRAKGTNPCGEQTLESGEMCCLVETFITKAESLQDYKRTLKFAYLYAKTVTLCTTHWVETNRVMLRNRRIGTSISGIAQFIEANGIDKLKTWVTEGYSTLKYYDDVYSEWLAIPRSIKITSVKPSGTVSLLAGVTPGIHYPESNYYIRRIRLRSNSELIPELKRVGYTIENDQMDSSAVVVEIPVKIENIRTNSEVSIWEQVALAAFMQTYWADNQVSCTVSFEPKDTKEIKHILDLFQYSLKGISFLPKAEIAKYPQMPYETITKDEYEKKIKIIKPMLFRDTAKEQATPELYCDGDSCSLL